MSFSFSRPALDDITTSAANEYFATGNYAANLTATGKSASGTGTKRKAETTVPDLGSGPEDYDDYTYGRSIDKSCNQVRGMIRRFLESGEMKKGEFADALGVSSSSLNNFLGKNGSMDGAGSDTYGNAWAFFKKRELAGKKAPKKAKMSATATASSSQAPPTDISNISLPGEECGGVPVYDSCDEIRKKINAYLVKPGVTAAQFCRDLEAQTATGQKIQSKQLTDFRSKKGAGAGNTSIVFYTAYVFFEKMRLAAGKPKSKHRKDMEATHIGGFDTDRQRGR